VLLAKHKRLGTWLPVGGEVEAGETPLEAARRELFEETGLHGTFAPLEGKSGHVGLVHVDGSPAGLLAYEEHPAGSKGMHLNFCFVAHVDGTVTPNDELAEARWVEDTHGLDCPPNVKQLVSLARGSHPLVDVARRWLDRFNARDLDGLLALYADDAVHVSPKLRDRQPETKGEIRGKAALHAWWRDAMDRLPGLRYDEQHLTGMNERVFMEYVRRVPGEADLLVAEVLVVRGGLIRESRVFHG
jgi:ADP-ribose pyrophosphatase YjhB (NUDIX family)